jgi:signal peptidase I
MLNVNIFLPLLRVVARRAHAATEAAPTLTKPRKKMRLNFLRLTGRFVYVAGATFCVGNTFCTVIGYPACVSGASMKPTLNDGVPPMPQEASLLAWLRQGVNWVFVNCWQGHRGHYERGDIVVFVSPKGKLTSSDVNRADSTRKITEPSQVEPG